MDSQSLKLFFKEKDKKNYLRILYELTTLALRDRELPKHYFTRLLYKDNIDNFLDYISYKTIGKLHTSPLLHDKNTIDILENKLLYNYHFEKTGVKVPKLLGYNLKGNFFHTSSKAEVEDDAGFAQYIKALMAQSSTQSIFIKPIGGIGGEGCFRIDLKDIGNNVVMDASLYKTLSSASYLYQETLIQNSEINRIYPSSINTLRIDTFMDKEGTIEVISAFMRFGRNGSFVDNGCSGGCFVPVDMNTGKLGKIGFTLLERGASTYESHPDTGFAFEGFTVPYFEEAKSMVKEAAGLLTGRLVGWDVGITVDGPVLIEGNHNYHIGMSEMAYGGYRKHPVYSKILSEYI